MAKLHQILAIDRGVGADTQRTVTLATQGIGVTGDQSPLNGLSRTYRPLGEPGTDRGEMFPPQSQHVQIRIEQDVLPMIAKAMTRLFDVKLTREDGNARARADVKVDGHVLLADVPVGYLMFLENQLAGVRNLVNSLPVLDPAEEWHPDPARGVYVTSERKTSKPIRVPRAQIMVEATKEHPAQVRPYEVEVPAGEWTLVKLSGALPAERRDEIAQRVTKLAEAVKFAREEANSLTVADDADAGEKVFGYLFG